MCVSLCSRYYLDLHSTELNQAVAVKTAAALFQQICYENKDRLMAGIIVGGWDPYEKGSVYSIPLGGMSSLPSTFLHVLALCVCFLDHVGLPLVS